MLIKIYICTIIFTFLASIPYIIRLFRYDLKTDDKFIIWLYLLSQCLDYR